MICIATFYSHFGAIHFRKLCEKAGIPARMMPVPRMLSSSCGTCVRTEVSDPDTLPRTEEMEQITVEHADRYTTLWTSD